MVFSTFLEVFFFTITPLIKPYIANNNTKHKKTYRIMLVKLGKMLHTKVIISPAQRFPTITMPHVCQKLNPNITPIQVPVQTPVSGSGTATNKNNPTTLSQNFLLIVFASTFSVCSIDLFSASSTILSDFDFILSSIFCAYLLPSFSLAS